MKLYLYLKKIEWKSLLVTFILFFKAYFRQIK